MKLKFYTLLGLTMSLLFFSNEIFAQRTIHFRINGVATNVDDMDGIGAGDSDPQWNYEITDNTFGIDDNDSYELSGTDCAGARSHLNTFFSQEYDCELPSSFSFVFRGFEDDPVGTDADSGDRTFSFNTSTLNTTGTAAWRNVFGGSGWIQVRAGGDDCGSLNLEGSPASSQGSGDVRYQIRLQYFITAGTLCKDECNDPYVIPTAAQYQCGGTQTSTPLNIDINATEPADASQFSHTTAGITCTIDGSTPEDIWVRTTIPDSSGGVTIQFENEGGCTGFACFTNITYAWYTSSNGSCSGLEYRGCDAVSCFFGCSDGEIQVDGRAGEDVWVRIWEEDDQGFDMTINQITPTAPADKCYTAMPLSQFGCNYQASSPTSGTYAEPDIASWTASAHPGGLCQDGDGDPGTNTTWASNENMVWYTFTHTGGPFNVAVDNMNCVGGAATAQLGVFSNSGTAQNPSCDLAAETGYGCSVGVGAVQLSIASMPPGEYLLVVDGNAGAQCDWEFFETIGGGPLPIQLVEFNANFNDDTENVDLTWASTVEENFAGFTVERSVDAVDFFPIDFVEGMGAEPGSTNYYAYSDESYPRVDVLYYRLRLDDNDGSFRYTNVKAVSPNIEATGISVLYDVYPNPTTSILYVPFQTVKEDEVTAVIYDMSGRIVKEIVQGENYQQGYHILEADVNDLAQGVYVIRFTAGNLAEMQRFIKY